MAKYTIISDVGKGILAILRDKLVPDVIDKAESIGLCEPKERGGYIVGVHPYDIREDTSNVAKEPVKLPDGAVQDPPAMIELSYVISVCSKADIESKSLDEAKIMGKIIQIFKDNPTIPARYMPADAETPIDNVPISMLPLNMEEKVKVWTMFGEPYKLSVFYIVGPVAIDSGNIHKAKTRVESIHLATKHYEFKHTPDLSTFLKEEDIDDEYTQYARELSGEGEGEGEEDEYGGGDEYGGDDGGFGDESGDDSGFGDEGGGDDGFGADGEAGDLGADGEAEDLGAEDEAEDLGADGEAEDLGAEDEAEDLGADGEAGDLGAEDEAEDLGADGEPEDLGADGEAGDLGADGEAGDLGAEDEAEDLGAEDEAEDLGAEDEAEDLGADGEAEDLGADGEAEDLGADGEAEDLGADGEAEDLGADGEAGDLGADGEPEPTQE